MDRTSGECANSDGLSGSDIHCLCQRPSGGTMSQTHHCGNTPDVSIKTVDDVSTAADFNSKQIPKYDWPE